jgi:hypothetical protein
MKKEKELTCHAQLVSFECGRDGALVNVLSEQDIPLRMIWAQLAKVWLD